MKTTWRKLFKKLSNEYNKTWHYKITIGWLRQSPKNFICGQPIKLLGIIKIPSLWLWKIANKNYKWNN